MSPSTSQHPRLRPACTCFIIPSAVLRRYAADAGTSTATRQALQNTAQETERLRGLREAHRVAGLRDVDRLMPAAAGAKPVVPSQHLYDCASRKALPGKPVPKPTGDYKQVFDTTAKVAEFYLKVLGRNSLDNKGFDLNSSLHYGVAYDNAFWNGAQMVYGDGDGQLFTKMFLSPDVIGHELTHGVTQYESALRYEGESGALNESLSDVFGTVFNQWLNNWDVTEPRGWLVGAGIIAKPYQAKGFTCLRDMVTPSAKHCLSPQPELYSQLDPSADVHDNSGVPNKAFALFARALGGQAWNLALLVWYDVATNRTLRSDARMAEFAKLSVAAAKKRGGTKVQSACRAAWKAVGIKA